MTIYDDGTLPGALGSKPFDGEGIPTRRTTVVEQGCCAVTCWIPTRPAGWAGAPQATRRAALASRRASVRQIFILPQGIHAAEIIASIPCGLYVTSLIGFGVNQIRGDYSRGAAGLWIENGALAYPVEEITIAGNLRQMLANIEMIGNDLDMRRRSPRPH